MFYCLFLPSSNSSSSNCCCGGGGSLFPDNAVYLTIVQYDYYYYVYF